jgi:hypothetical protein
MHASSRDISLGQCQKYFGLRNGGNDVLTYFGQNISIWNVNTPVLGSPISTLLSVKRHRNGCASVGEPNFVPFSTLPFIKRYRNGCASVGESNFVPFPTPVFLIRQRRTISLTLAPPSAASLVPQRITLWVCNNRD